MPRQDLTLSLAYDGVDNNAPLFSERNPVTAKWGMADEGTALGASECSAQIDNRTGLYDPDDAAGDLYGKVGLSTPATVMLGPEVLADGTVASWLPDREIKGPAWTDVLITGPSRRVNGSKDVQSATRRTVKAMIRNGTGPEGGYWPLEDGPNTAVTESLVPGVPGMEVYDFANRAAGDTYVTGRLRFGEGIGPPGSKPILDTVDGGSLRVLLPKTSAFNGVWTLDWTSRFPLNAADSTPGSMLTVIMADAGAVGQIDVDAGPTWRIFYGAVASNYTGRAIDAGEGLATAAPYNDGLPHHFQLKAVQSGGDVSLQMRYDGNLVGIGGDYTDDGLPTATLGQITELRINAQGGEGGAWQPSIGQVMLWYDNGNSLSAGEDQATWLNGYPTEGAEDRFGRLCDEHTIPYSIDGDGDSQAEMGPQYPAALPELLREIKDTDGGLMYDHRAWNELVMRPGRTLMNQVPALALAFEDNVAPPLRPATDDLNAANDVTANQNNGATYHVSRETGPRNASDPVDDPEGVGRQERRLDVNPYDSARLVDIAGWALHEGTTPAARYRQVTIDLGKHPDLIPDVMALRPGDLISIEGLTADLVELMVLGGADVVGAATRRLTLNCADGSPYRIPAVGLTGSKRIGHANSWLAANYTAGATSLSVASSGALWSTTASAFDIRMAGMVLHVTAVAGASSPQTFTVDATPVNGVSRDVTATGAAGALTRIDIDRPVFIGR
jgi:hypothetical protein